VPPNTRPPVAYNPSFLGNYHLNIDAWFTPEERNRLETAGGGRRLDASTYSRAVAQKVLTTTVGHARFMKVLLLGATGFIGTRIAAEAQARGHEVIPCGRDAEAMTRRFPGAFLVRGNLAKDGVDAWLARVDGVDAVINAVGAMTGDLERLQGSGPSTLFDACATAGINKVAQISALGAATGKTRFLRTKRVADDHLLKLRGRGGRDGWIVVRPSLVIGHGGYSTGLLSSLAALPVRVRFANDGWSVQPIHVSDLARAIVDLLEKDSVPPTLDLVGEEPLNVDDVIEWLRMWLGLSEGPIFTVPAPMLEVAAFPGHVLPGWPVSPEMFVMLAEGNTADTGPETAVLGWTPRPLGKALLADPVGPADIVYARMLAVRPLVKLMMAALWIGTAIISVFFVPAGVSEAMLANLDLTGGWATTAIYGGSLVDLLIGVGILALPRHVKLMAAIQIAVAIIFMAIASFAAPEAWVHPFGPLLKNAAIIAAALALWAMDE